MNKPMKNLMPRFAFGACVSDRVMLGGFQFSKQGGAASASPVGQGRFKIDGSYLQRRTVTVSLLVLAGLLALPVYAVQHL
jgi:hypothetical protein